ncbi:MAG TPA: hypothetical protein ENJ09_10280 [Planctomycetes bacterium]|nr:hypothetical protein [Planctomycetota bacterium]
MARLTPEKLALLRKRMAAKGIEKKRSAVIPRREGASDEAPLSNGQSRLWFLDQFDPGSSLYNDSLALTIRAAEPGFELDVDAFRRAFAEVLRRHEVLRTSFHNGPTGPVQHIHPVEEARLGEEIPFVVRDLRELGETNARAELERLLLADVQEPFQLDRLPLLRVLLARVTDDEWVFGLPIHHIVSDGVSYSIIYAELAALYRAYTAGRPSPLEELPIQFADFAAWEHGKLDEAWIEEKLGFWKRYLGGDLPRIAWPAKDAQPKNRGAYHRLRFSDALYSALQRFCRENEVTSNWVLMAAYFVMLHTLGGQEDIRIGTPSSTRKHAELEGLVGFFVQTVLLRVDLSGNPSFREVLARTRATALEVSKVEDVPFDRVVRAIRPQRRNDQVPLIQAWIAPMKDLMDPPRIPGAETSYEIVDGKIARFDFAIILDEARGGVTGFCEYDTDLFEPEVAAELSDRYQAILRQAVDHPDTTLKLFRGTFPAPAKPGLSSGPTPLPRTQRRRAPKSMQRVKRRPTT